MSSMSVAKHLLIEWNEETLGLGVSSMDQTHREFLQLLNQLDQASGQTFLELFTELLEHTRSHFEAEETMMVECRFPAIAEHQHEHRRILADLNRIERQIHRGVLSFARAYLRESMPPWFRLHAATMDSALAACWIQYQTEQEVPQR